MSDSTAPQPTTQASKGVFVLVLQHPQERREPLATAAVAAAALRRARLVVGLSWPNLSRALGRNADPRRWGVLYLGSAQPAAFASEAGVVPTDRRGEPGEDPEPVLAGLES